MSFGEKLLEHDADLLAVRRRERIELEGMLADRQLLVMRRAGDRTIDVGELAAAWLFPLPDLRDHIFASAVGHTGSFVAQPNKELGTDGGAFQCQACD